MKSLLSLQSKTVEKPSPAAKPASKPVSKPKPDPNQSMPKITKKVIEDPKKKKPKDEVMERYDEKLAVMSRKSFFCHQTSFLWVRSKMDLDGLSSIYPGSISPLKGPSNFI